MRQSFEKNLSRWASLHPMLFSMVCSIASAYFIYGLALILHPYLSTVIFNIWLLPYIAGFYFMVYSLPMSLGRSAKQVIQVFTMPIVLLLLSIMGHLVFMNHTSSVSSVIIFFMNVLSPILAGFSQLILGLGIFCRSVFLSQENSLT